MEPQAPSNPSAELEEIAHTDAKKADALDRTLETSHSANPESEQQQAREKMGALIDKLDASVKEKGIIAQIVGDKDETGDHRGAILTEPVIQGERSDRRAVGFVVLTPDGPMIIDANRERAVYDLMRQTGTPEEYDRNREFLKRIKYIAEPLQGTTPRIMSYRLENPGTTTLYMRPLEQSAMSDVNVEDIFEKSVAKAAKPLEARQNQAANAVKLADTLTGKF